MFKKTLKFAGYAILAFSLGIAGGYTYAEYETKCEKEITNVK